VGWPLVGRDDELAELEAAIALGHGVLLAASAGVGKTRLIEAVLDRARARGVTTVNVVGSRASASIPLGCLSGLLANVDDVPEGAAGLVRIRRALEHASQGRPIVLAIDDAHWLDDASAALVHQLVAGNDATVIASVREGEEVPPEVTALWKDGLLERVDLAPLASDAVIALLAQVLGGQVERAGALRLHERCRGNALFLRELLDEATRLGLVQQHHGVWTIGDPPARSARLAELVAERIGDLDASALEALELVALGEPIGLASLDRIASLSAVEALEQRGLVRVHVDGNRTEVRLEHPIHGDVVRAQLPELRRRRLLLALASELEGHGARRRGDRMRATLLRLDAGGSPAADALQEAAWEAYIASAVVVAERLARAAFAAAPSYETAQLLARVLFERGLYDEQQAILSKAAELAHDEADMVLAAVARAGGLFWGLGDLQGAQQTLIDTEAEITDSVDDLWEIRGTRALIESQAGDQRAAIALLDDCPDLQTLGQRAHGQIALALAFALPGIGRGDEGLAIIDRAMSRRVVDETAALTLHVNSLLSAARPFAFVGLGSLSEAEAAARAGYEAALTAGEHAIQAYFDLSLGWVRTNQGQLAEAIHDYRECAVLFRTQGHRGPARWALGGLLFAAGLARDHDVAHEAARALDELGPHPAGLLEVGIMRARAWAALAADDPGAARAHLTAAAELARERNTPPDEAACLHDRVRLGDAAAVVERLVELAPLCAGELVHTMAEHATGLVADDVDVLEDVAERFAEMGFLLKAAEAAMGAAEAAARGGDQGRAARLTNRATELADRCETPATPMLTSPSRPIPLTSREREVALLAAAGLTSRAIAERLFLSARTVDNHLARIYGKLGVSGRAELRSALG
jgi:DNA-binding CsgD family transcriptional regulator